MFGKSITLFKIFGFKVRIDFSWLLIALLITWSLAEGVFPENYEGLSETVYWWMGIIGALGLFISVVFHELTHSLVARQFGMPMKGITLFIFGGVAEMEDEPPSAKAEFFMSAAGPLSSILLGFIFYGILSLGGNWPKSITGVLSYLRWINFILAGFNLLPAFPLDGGRVLRAILWGWKKKIRWATKVTSSIGKGFGYFLMFTGIFNLIVGGYMGGLWWFLIGLFLSNAAKMSYRQLVTKQALKGEPVRRFMKSEPVTVPSGITVRDFTENYLYKHYYKMFPVSDDGELKGCITTKDIKEIPQEEWDQRKIEEVYRSCSEINAVGPDTDAVQALTMMNKTGNSRLMVMEGDKLIGIITLKDLLRFLSLKLDLEEEEIEDQMPVNQ